MKVERILRAAEFGEVKERGVRARAGTISVAAVPRESGIPRLGLVVSSAVGNSPQRNRLKRVIREFFRMNKGAFLPGDFVVIPRQGAAALENEEIRIQLRRAFEALGEKLKR